MSAARPMPFSFAVNERVTGSNRPKLAARRTSRMPAASSAMITFCFSAASSAMTYTAATAIAATPGHHSGRRSLAVTTGSDALTDLLPDEPRRSPRHQRDHHGEGEHVLVGAGER